MKASLILLAVALVALTACQSEKKSTPSAGSPGKSASLRTMEQVAISAYKCWFDSKDPAFKPYRLANELNSFTGTPRLLLVPARNFEGRPLLVIQAQGTSSQVDLFGPLMDEPLGARVAADVGRWRGGNPSCGAAA
jgi:hypothetical protein